jgi:hypothetical protein
VPAALLELARIRALGEYAQADELANLGRLLHRQVIEVDRGYVTDILTTFMTSDRARASVVEHRSEVDTPAFR